MRGREQTPGQVRPRRKWTLWTSIVIIGGVFIMGTVVVIVKSLSPEPATVSAPAPNPAPTVAPTVNGCPAGPELLDGRLDIAPEAQWVTIGESTFPVSPTLTQPESGVWECFDRTPSGAVLAAAAGISQLSSPTPDMRELAIERRVVAGPVQDEMLAGVANATGSDVSLRLRVSGFRLAEYTGDTARVDVAFTGAGEGATVYMAMLIPMIWDEERGDWLLNYGENDRLPPAILPNLAGYVLWPADTSGVQGG